MPQVWRRRPTSSPSVDAYRADDPVLCPASARSRSRPDGAIQCVPRNRWRAYADRPPATNRPPPSGCTAPQVPPYPDRISPLSACTWPHTTAPPQSARFLGSPRGRLHRHHASQSETWPNSSPTIDRCQTSRPIRAPLATDSRRLTAQRPILTHGSHRCARGRARRASRATRRQARSIACSRPRPV